MDSTTCVGKQKNLLQNCFNRLHPFLEHCFTTFRNCDVCGAPQIHPLFLHDLAVLGRLSVGQNLARALTVLFSIRPALGLLERRPQKLLTIPLGPVGETARTRCMSGTLETEAPGHARSVRSSMYTMNCAKNQVKNLILPRFQCDASKISVFSMHDTLGVPNVTFSMRQWTQEQRHRELKQSTCARLVARSKDPENLDSMICECRCQQNGPHHLILMLNNRNRRNESRQTVPKLNSIRE